MARAISAPSVRWLRPCCAVLVAFSALFAAAATTESRPGRGVALDMPQRWLGKKGVLPVLLVLSSVFWSFYFCVLKEMGM